MIVPGVFPGGRLAERIAGYRRARRRAGGPQHRWTRLDLVWLRRAAAPVETHVHVTVPSVTATHVALASVTLALAAPLVLRVAPGRPPAGTSVRVRGRHVPVTGAPARRWVRDRAYRLQLRLVPRFSRDRHENVREVRGPLDRLPGARTLPRARRVRHDSDATPDRRVGIVEHVRVIGVRAGDDPRAARPRTRTSTTLRALAVGAGFLRRRCEPARDGAPAVGIPSLIQAPSARPVARLPDRGVRARLPARPETFRPRQSSATRESRAVASRGGPAAATVLASAVVARPTTRHAAVPDFVPGGPRTPARMALAPVPRAPAPPEASLGERTRQELVTTVREQVETIVDDAVRTRMGAWPGEANAIAERLYSDLGSRLEFERERLGKV